MSLVGGGAIRESRWYLLKKELGSDHNLEKIAEEIEGRIVARQIFSMSSSSNLGPTSIAKEEIAKIERGRLFIRTSEVGAFAAALAAAASNYSTAATAASGTAAVQTAAATVATNATAAATVAASTNVTAVAVVAALGVAASLALAKALKAKVDQEEVTVRPSQESAAEQEPSSSSPEPKAEPSQSASTSSPKPESRSGSALRPAIQEVTVEETSPSESAAPSPKPEVQPTSVLEQPKTESQPSFISLPIPAMTEDQGQADFTAEEVIMYCPAKDLQKVGSQEKMREKILTLSDEDQEGKVPINSMDVSKRFCYKMDDEELKKVLNDVIVEYIEKRMKELRGKLPIEQGEGLTYDRPIEDAEDFKAAIESLSKAEGKLMMKARDSEETKIKERLIDFLTELRALVNDLTSRPVSWVGNQAESSALTVFSEREPPEIFAPKAVLTKALAKKPSLDRMPFDADQNSIQLWSGRVPVDLLRIWINAIYEDPRTDLTVQEIQEKFRALNQTPPTMDIEVLSRSLSSVAKQASERFNRLLPEPVAAAPLKKSLSYRLYRDMVSSLYTTRPAEVVDDKDQVFYRRVDSDMDSLKLPRYSPSRVVVTTLTESPTRIVKIVLQAAPTNSDRKAELFSDESLLPGSPVVVYEMKSTYRPDKRSWFLQDYGLFGPLWYAEQIRKRTITKQRAVPYLQFSQTSSEFYTKSLSVSLPSLLKTANDPDEERQMLGIYGMLEDLPIFKKKQIAGRRTQKEREAYQNRWKKFDAIRRFAAKMEGEFEDDEFQISKDAVSEALFGIDSVAMNFGFKQYEGVSKENRASLGSPDFGDDPINEFTRAADFLKNLNSSERADFARSCFARKPYVFVGEPDKVDQARTIKMDCMLFIVISLLPEPRSARQFYVNYPTPSIFRTDSSPTLAGGARELALLESQWRTLSFRLAAVSVSELEVVNPFLARERKAQELKKAREIDVILSTWDVFLPVWNLLRVLRGAVVDLRTLSRLVSPFAPKEETPLIWLIRDRMSKDKSGELSPKDVMANGHSVVTGSKTYMTGHVVCQMWIDNLGTLPRFSEAISLLKKSVRSGPLTMYSVMWQFRELSNLINDEAEDSDGDSDNRILAEKRLELRRNQVIQSAEQHRRLIAYVEKLDESVKSFYVNPMDLMNVIGIEALNELIAQKKKSHSIPVVSKQLSRTTQVSSVRKVKTATLKKELRLMEAENLMLTEWIREYGGFSLDSLRTAKKEYFEKEAQVLTAIFGGGDLSVRDFPKIDLLKEPPMTAAAEKAQNIRFIVANMIEESIASGANAAFNNLIRRGAIDGAIAQLDASGGLQVPEASKPYIKPEDVRQQIMEWWGSEKMQINEDLAVHKPFLGRKVVWKSQPEPDLLRPKDWTSSESLISVGKVDNERIAKDFARLRKNPSQVSAATLRQSTELLRNSSKVNFAQWRTYGSLLFRAVVAPDADDRIRRGHGSFDAVSMLESRDRLFAKPFKENRPDQEVESSSNYLTGQRNYLTPLEILLAVEGLVSSHARVQPVRFGPTLDWPSPMTDWFEVWKTSVPEDRWMQLAIRTAGLSGGLTRKTVKDYRNFANRLAGLSQGPTRVDAVTFSTLARRISTIRMPSRVDPTNFRSLSSRWAARSNNFLS